MDNNTLLMIKKYLKLSTYYAIEFYDKYRKRENINNDRFEIIIHGNGMDVFDKIKNIRISFDFFRYNGIYIRYFDIWKIKMFLKENSEYCILLEDFNKNIKLLEKLRYIKKYYNCNYYQLTNKGENQLINLIFNNFSTKI